MVTPYLGRVSTEEDCRRVSKEIDAMLEELGLEIHKKNFIFCLSRPKKKFVLCISLEGSIGGR